MATSSSGEMRGADRPTQSSSGQCTTVGELYDLSPEAILWIHLYHDLLLAITRTPASPLVIVTGGIVYKNFLNRFKSGSFANEKERFLYERKALLPTRLAMINSTSKRRKCHDAPVIDQITLTSDMLEKYKELRGSLEPSEEIPKLEQDAALWGFLNVEVHKAYPELYPIISKDQDLSTKESDRDGQQLTQVTNANAANVQSAPTQATYAPLYSFHSNAPASSPNIPSKPNLTLAIKGIYMKDNKETKSNNGPRADQERVQRLSTTERPHQRQPEKVLGQKPPRQDAEVPKHKAASFPEHPVAEPTKTKKRKASLNVEQKDVVKAKKSAVGKVHIKKKWSKEEHNILFHTINEWCHENGVDKLEMKVVNQICFDVLAATGSSRDKSIVASKTKNTKEIIDLVKKAKDMALHVEDFPRELRYPLTVLPLIAE
jgi:hypothetical protein